MGGSRGKNIPPVKGAAGRGGAPIAGPVEFHSSQRRSLGQNAAEQAIVRANQKARLGLDGHRPSTTPHPRIHNGQVNGARRQIGVGRHQGKASRRHILRRDPMAEVDELSLWGKGMNHPFHNAHIGILQAKIRQQANKRHTLLRLEDPSLRIPKDNSAYGWGG
jgi:hypothetical protein